MILNKVTYKEEKTENIKLWAKILLVVAFMSIVGCTLLLFLKYSGFKQNFDISIAMWNVLYVPIILVFFQGFIIRYTKNNITVLSKMVKIPFFKNKYIAIKDMLAIIFVSIIFGIISTPYLNILFIFITFLTNILIYKMNTYIYPIMIAVASKAIMYFFSINYLIGYCLGCSIILLVIGCKIFLKEKKQD